MSSGSILRTRFIVMLVLLATVPLLVGLLVVAREGQAALDQSVTQLGSDLAALQLVSHHMGTDLEARQHLLTDLAQAAAKADSNGERFLTDALQQAPEIRAVTLCKADGSVLAQAGRVAQLPVPPGLVSDALQRGAVVGPVSVDAVNQDAAIQLAARVSEAVCLVEELSLRSIWHDESQTTARLHSDVVAATGSGTVIWTASQMHHVGEQIDNVQDYSTLSVLDGENGRIVRGSVPLGLRGWRLLWERHVPITTSSAIWMHALWYTLVSALLALLAGMMLTRSVQGRLQQVVDAAQEIGRGNLEVTVPTGPGDELGALAASVRALQSRVRQTIGEQQRQMEQTKLVLAARVDELNAIHSFSEGMTGKDDLQKLLGMLVDKTMELFDSQILLVWLRESGGAMELAEHRGLVAEEAERARRNPPDTALPLYEPVFARQEVLALDHPADLAELTRRLPVKESRAYCAIPLMAVGGRVGMIEILTPDANLLSPDILKLLLTLGREAGLVIRNMQLFVDVTNERNRSQLLLQAIAEGVWSLDADMRITSFNQAAETMTGWKAPEAIGRKCWEVFEGRDAQGVLVCNPETCYVAKALRAGEPPPSYELRLRVRDGSHLAASFLPSTWRNASGKVADVVNTFRDVTQMRELEQLRNSLLSTVTHELKTPLTSIKGCVDTLMHPKANFNKDAMRSFLGIIREEADKLNYLVTDLIHAAQVSSEMMVLDHQDVNLKPLVEKVVADAAGGSSTRRHNFTTSFTVPGDVVCDVARIEYVLQHLLGNAVKFSPQGGEVRVLVESYDEEWLSVSVSDEGVGIPATQQSRIFDVFHRVDVADTRSIYGIGMGLFLARKIVEAHGGRIWVDSSVGGGSKFSFTLRRSRLSLPPVPAPEASTTSAG
ncbi:MAG: ATP-binding protein [Candidatus Xenobia bacterium]